MFSAIKSVFMNSLFMIVRYTFVLVIFSNCKITHRIVDSGEVVEDVNTFWKTVNSIDTPYINISQKAWYQDGIGITQICQINFVTNGSDQSINISTIGYRFLDLKKKWAYEYNSLSDTALMMRKYRFSDTTRFIGGWNFVNRISHPIDSFRILPDTTISKITYKQAKTSFLINKTKYEGICIFRCDIKKSNFQINKAISNQMGCQLAFFRKYPVENPQSKNDEEIKFISNHFPDSIVKVFTAWKKNELLYTVE